MLFGVAQKYCNTRLTIYYRTGDWYENTIEDGDSAGSEAVVDEM